MSSFVLEDACSKPSKLMATEMSFNGVSYMTPPPGVFLKGVFKSSTPIRSDDEVEHTAGLSTSDPEALPGACSWEAHVKGECKPCAYFWAEKDGCRRGDDCDFCHEYHIPVKKKVTKYTLKRRKKERLQRESEKAAAAAEDAKWQSLKVGAPEDGKNLDGGFQYDVPARIIVESTEDLAGQRASSCDVEAVSGGTDLIEYVPARVEIPMSNEISCSNQMASAVTSSLTMAPYPTATPPMPPMPPPTTKPPAGGRLGITPPPGLFVPHTALSVQSHPRVRSDVLKASAVTSSLTMSPTPTAMPPKRAAPPPTTKPPTGGMLGIRQPPGLFVPRTHHSVQTSSHVRTDVFQVFDSCSKSLVSAASNEWCQQSAHKTPMDFAVASF